MPSASFIQTKHSAGSFINIFETMAIFSFVAILDKAESGYLLQRQRIKCPEWLGEIKLTKKGA